jgi:hypothetical protein
MSPPPYDGVVRRWDVAQRRDPERALCAFAGRSLTAGEWARYLPGVPYEAVCG